MKKISTKLMSLLTLLITSLIVSNFFLFFMIQSIKESAEVINLSGKIRGNIQRLVKFTVAEKETSELIKKIDIYFQELKEKQNNLKLPLVQYSEDISKCMNSCWENIKNIIRDYSPNKEDNLLSLSEKCWKVADDMTFRFQKISQQNTDYFIVLFIINTMISFLTLILLLLISKKDIVEKLEFYANYDNLTNTLNRHSFIELYNKFKKRKEKFPMSFIIFDIDDFKKINDIYGHDIGDNVLKIISKKIKDTIRSTDIFSRWGGEEFVILFPNTSSERAKVVAEKIRKVIEELKFKEGFKVTISIGLTGVFIDEDLSVVLKRADKALYRAKKSGKNRVEIAKE